jgi:uncharacterized damage-inducible protein DinB
MSIGTRYLTAALVLTAAATITSAQQAHGAKTSAPAPTLVSVMETQLSMLEGQFVPAAEAMPEAGYSFMPQTGEQNGVRTFALQVKHVATANGVFYGAMLGQPLPQGVTLAGAMNGPDEIRTKEQILKYLKDSFALGHKAVATLTPQRALTPLAKPPMPTMTTPLALVTWSSAHAWDHYGQMVEYLRLNGIVPPASQGQPPANPRTNANAAAKPIIR